MAILAVLSPPKIIVDQSQLWPSGKLEQIDDGDDDDDDDDSCVRPQQWYYVYCTQPPGW